MGLYRCTGGSGGGGGGDVPLLTQAQWDALTTPQKQAYNLVAIQKANSGFERGKLVNGADYRDTYLIASDPSSIVCEASVDNFVDQSPTWGVGSKPIQFSNGYPTLDTVEEAVLIPVLTSGVYAYADMGNINTPFTAYVVMKALNPGQVSRLIMAARMRSTAQCICLVGANITVSSWNNDTPTGVSSANYFAAAMQFSQTGSNGAGGMVYGTNYISKSPNAVGQYITIGRTDINPSPSDAEPTDVKVKYFGLTNVGESETVIQNNLANIHNIFFN